MSVSGTQAKNDNVRVVHLGGHGEKSGLGFVWPVDASSGAKSVVTAAPLDAKIFLELIKLELPPQAEMAWGVECVFLNACAQLAMGEGLREVGVRWVLCWEGHPRDPVSRAFADEFYKSLNTPGRDRNYRYAFNRARVACRDKGPPL